jgi:hypothetical protein
MVIYLMVKLAMQDSQRTILWPAMGVFGNSADGTTAEEAQEDARYQRFMTAVSKPQPAARKQGPDCCKQPKQGLKRGPEEPLKENLRPVHGKRQPKSKT